MSKETTYIFLLPPGARVTLTNRRLYKRRFLARPLGTLGFSCFSTCSGAGHRCDELPGLRAYGVGRIEGGLTLGH
jgi:hypothetical protein